MKDFYSTGLTHFDLVKRNNEILGNAVFTNKFKPGTILRNNHHAEILEQLTEKYKIF